MAIPAPRRAARGRDTDTLFGLLAPDPGLRQPASFYEPLINQVSDVYFRTSGSVTAAMREAITATNDALYRENRGNVPVGLAAAILREHELYLAVSGPARCIFANAQRIEKLPADDELMEPMIALGTETVPDIRFYHREVQQGDILILADTSLNHVREDALRYALGEGEVDTALNNLRGVAGNRAAAVVVKFVEPLPQDAILPAPETAARRPAPVSVPASPSPAPAPAGAGAPSSSLPFFRQAGRDLALGTARTVEGIRRLVGRRPTTDEYDNLLTERYHLSTGIQVGVAVAVAVLVALLTTFVYRMRGQTTQYDQYVRQAIAESEQARAAGSDQGTARPHWENALWLLGQARQIRAPGANLSEIDEMRQEALSALDAYDQVTRVTPTLLRTYQPGAVLRGPVVQGLNLYVIDTINDILYREDLDETGTVLVNREPQIITRQGDIAGNQVVSGLIDLAWMEDGGVPQRNVLAVLARNGLLITYSPSWNVTAATLPGYEAWVDPRAIAVYDRDLYILDAGANEIWRYEAGVDAYDRTPQRYFTEVVPDLGDAIDMDIDPNGNLYVLHADGLITKYSFGRPERFEVQGLPQPVTRPTALFLSLSLFDRTFFITDPGGGRLYLTSVTGTFLANYKDSEDFIFESISGVFNQDRPPFVYITAGNQLYYFARP